MKKCRRSLLPVGRTHSLSRLHRVFAVSLALCSFSAFLIADLVRPRDASVGRVLQLHADTPTAPSPPGAASGLSAGDPSRQDETAQPGRGTRFVAIPLDVVRIGGDFLQAVGDQGKLFARRECDQAGTCRMVEPEMVGSYSWAILAEAGALRATGDQRHRARIRELYDRWTKLADGASEMFGLFQLYDAYRATGDLDLLASFFNRTELYLRFLQDSWKSSKQPRRGEPMLLATLVRQLANAAEVFNHPEVSAKFVMPSSQTSGLVRPGDRKREFLAAAKHLLRDLEAAVRDATAPPLTTKGRSVPQFSCWVQWSKAALYEASKDRQILFEMQEFFDSVSLAEGKQSLHLETLQSILPCIQSLLTLGTRDPRYTVQAEELFRRYILPNWDAPVQPLCGGAGGLLTIPVPYAVTTIPCQLNSEYVSDTAWAMFLAAQFPPADVMVRE